MRTLDFAGIVEAVGEVQAFLNNNNRGEEPVQVEEEMSSPLSSPPPSSQLIDPTQPPERERKIPDSQSPTPSPISSSPRSPVPPIPSSPPPQTHQSIPKPIPPFSASPPQIPILVISPLHAAFTPPVFPAPTTKHQSHPSQQPSIMALAAVHSLISMEIRRDIARRHGVCVVILTDTVMDRGAVDVIVRAGVDGLVGLREKRDGVEVVVEGGAGRDLLNGL